MPGHFVLHYENSEEQAQKYCDCKFPSFAAMNNKSYKSDMVKCRCGEDDDLHRLQWTWRQNPESDVHVKDQDVVFHPIFSQGTAYVRGERELSVGMVHFWEIRAITTLVGTDVMFGIANEDMDLDCFKFHFVSALGSNEQSWGYSYSGYIQHDGKKIKYGRKCSQGCVIGVLLDRLHGHLQFFLNRRPLGIAFKNIPLDPSVKLYPIVLSTSAKSVIRLINSISQPDCLQLRAYRALTKMPSAMRELHQMRGLRPLVRSYWFLTPEMYTQETKYEGLDLDLADEALLCSVRRPRKHKYTANVNEDNEDDEDIYANAHKIFAAASDSEDEEEDHQHLPSELMADEYFGGILHH